MSMSFAATFKFVEDMLDYKEKHSILLVAPYGQGKSTLFKSVARKRNIPFVDKRLSQKDVGDLMGMPFCIGGRTYFAPPDWFPMQENDILDLQKKLNLSSADLIKHAPAGILCLDEIDRATREVQQAGFELVLDRALNEKPILPGWVIGAGINADGDVYHVNDMDIAFIDRFVYINFAPTKDEWFVFARGEGQVHEAVVNFLTMRDDLMDPSKEIIMNKPGQKLYSRRSWERFSMHLKDFAALETKRQSGLDLLDGSPETLALLSSHAAGYVGEDVAGVFRNYVAMHYKSLNGDMILNKWGPAIEKEIQKLITDKTKAVELASLPKLIVNFIEDKKIARFTDDQAYNLTEFMCQLPNENAGAFWKFFNSKCRDLSKAWFDSKFKVKIAPKIKASLSNPATGKGTV